VVVTAKKRPEAVHGIANTIEAFMADELNSQGLSKAIDINKLASNMAISNRDLTRNSSSSLSVIPMSSVTRCLLEYS